MTCQVSDLVPRERFKNNTDEKPTVEEGNQRPNTAAAVAAAAG